MNANEQNTDPDHGKTRDHDPHQTVRSGQPTTSPNWSEIPRQIGRYRIERQLGVGGFGRVLLAQDEQLRRAVAIKVPHAHLIATPEDIETFLIEAQTLAHLDHPNIVPVYDVGSAEGIPCFVVSKYVEGSDLGQRISEARLPFTESVRLVATLGRALHYAHTQGFVHRDVKPGNILLDHEDTPYLVDFGLALRDVDIGKGPRVAGTPAYMSPEQASGEGHRVDGRSDIFSLGAVLYELLAGQRMFASDATSELLSMIITREPESPRAVNDLIPIELERICLKALSKRISDRYTTAKDMVEEMDAFLAEQRECSQQSRDRSGTASRPPSESTIKDVSQRDRCREGGMRVVPKGLRSFDEHDADFFLGLLPGPRDRDGLPSSIRFWKKRLEESDPEKTFPVGLIYGPSGCGKSSLVRAGLIPRLSDNLRVVFVESTASDTESCLGRGLEYHFPQLSGASDLSDMAARLRRGRQPRSPEKVVIILDQFEQWLHAHRGVEDTELMQALRQCDGGNLQSIVMVRDDFWMAATRFMRELEIRLEEGNNSAAVDLFPLAHARRVLAAFGRAYGELPPGDLQQVPECEAFVCRAIDGIAEEERVVCLRLALFADMMKGKPWTLSTLRQAGGLQGMGVTFLDETFCAASAPPEHRLHQRAARDVLKSLLPDKDSALKGQLRSYDELLTASGYRARPHEFDNLLEILDRRTRLITPADDEGRDRNETLDQPVGKVQRQYQLTHDYLVPALRTWLTQKQRATRRGRAELRLALRAAHWQAKPETRQLPSWWEDLSIRLFTRRRTWTDPQRTMMGKSARFYGLRTLWGLALLLVAAAALVVTRQRVTDSNRRTVAANMVNALLKADLNNVPQMIDNLHQHRPWIDDLLQAAHQQASDQSPERLRTSLALLRHDPQRVDEVASRLLQAKPSEVAVLIQAISPYRATVTARFWDVLQRKSSTSGQRLRAACALATLDPEGDQWPTVRHDVAGMLASVQVAYLSYWRAALQPVASQLLDPLEAIFRDRQRSELERSLATSLLVDYASGDANRLANLLCVAGAGDFEVLLHALRLNEGEAVTTLESVLAEEPRPIWTDPPIRADWARVPAEIGRQLEAAEGILHERFALCQSLPLTAWDVVSGALTESGYRPIRFRPFGVANSVRVAAVWTRDGNRWCVAHGKAPSDIQELDTRLRKTKLVPQDVIGYVNRGQEDTTTVSYAALWSAAASQNTTTQLSVGLSLDDIQETYLMLLSDSFRPLVYSRVMDPDGELSYSAIWLREQGKLSPRHESFTGTASHFRGDIFPDLLQTDAMITQTAFLSTSERRLRAMLAHAESILAVDAQAGSELLNRAFACFHLRQNEQAMEDLTYLIKHTKSDVSKLLGLRAILYARLDRASEAKRDTAQVVETTTDAHVRNFVSCAVDFCLRNDKEAEQRLHAMIAADPESPYPYHTAVCAYAEASARFSSTDPARSERFAEQALAMLEQAYVHGYREFYTIQREPLLDILRVNPQFSDLLRRTQQGCLYSGTWSASSTHESAELHGIDPKDLLRRAPELISKGYRPASCCVVDLGDLGGPVTTSVWHRPLISDPMKETLAKRRANAAAALVRMRRVEKVWSRLRFQPDPRLRSWLIHRLSRRRVDIKDLVERLYVEPNTSARQGLILAIGGYSPGRIAPETRQKTTAHLRQLLETDPDAGIHGASEWLLRTWGYETEIQGVRRKLSERPKKRRDSWLKRSLSWPSGPASMRPVRPRQWYVNNQEQTFVKLGPVDEYLMGSPPTETDREDGPEGTVEAIHRRSIARRFAIMAHEVSVEQFLRFRKNHLYDARYARTPDCPVNRVSWCDAAAYCNWLSEQEGIPKKQWCYAPNVKGEYSVGMKPYNDFLQRTGYRLPTNAEWEYACRAGSVTKFQHGETEDLLADYAWYAKNSDDASLPSGVLMPNLWGLFAMHGNVAEWCHGLIRDYKVMVNGLPMGDPPDVEAVVDFQERTLRGGSFSGPAPLLRSALRIGYKPTSAYDNAGFRPARTIRTQVGIQR